MVEQVRSPGPVPDRDRILNSDNQGKDFQATHLLDVLLLRTVRLQRLERNELR